MLNIRRLWFGFIACVSLLQPAILLAEEEQPLVSILSISESEPYRLSAAGIIMSLKEARPELQIDQHWTDGSDAQLQNAIRAIGTRHPVVVVVLGDQALQALRSSDIETPVVAALISSHSVIASFQNTTGIELEIPMARQLAVIRELLPEAQRFGMLFSPRSNQHKVDEARKLLGTKGLSFVASAVSSPAELPGALESIARRVDVIWGIPDPIVMNSRTAKPVLVEAFRKNVALVGPTPSWTRAGALLALEWDYSDIGLQASELVVEIVNGSTAQSLPVSGPRIIAYSLNLRTANQINIQLNDLHIISASKVYQ
jgi:putative ABC transport system substrate-binding protein